MHRSLLALTFALLPLAAAHAHDEHEHGSLGKHEHGVAALNLAVDGNILEIDLESPAMNIVGFEHAASSADDKAAAIAARTQLEKPLALFGLPQDAGCSLAEQSVTSPLFGNGQPHAEADRDDDDDDDGHHHEHSDVDAAYRLDCKNPDALTQIDFAPFFRQFSATHTINVQAIGPNGQQGAQLSPAQAVLRLK
jgi:hypothetical protein